MHCWVSRQVNLALICVVVEDDTFLRGIKYHKVVNLMAAVIHTDSLNECKSFYCSEEEELQTDMDQKV